MRLVKIDFPTLIVGLRWQEQNKEILLHVQADNYDYMPIRGWWVDKDDVPLEEQLPREKGFQIYPNPYGEKKSWLCFQGWREYHDHPCHQNVSWSSIKNKREYRLPGIIQKLLIDLNSTGVMSIG